ncbi:MAG: hypothetical protein COB46_10155 [Rhodospirillaceae bacterium]|nr:MAG: hypothetical protein COB46_10155 [Rhodospirillaceae bacterium]
MKYYTTNEIAELWEATFPLLEALESDMKELAKKKPIDALNDNKVSIINRLLEDVRIVLAEQKAIKYLDLLDAEVIPSNSDVAIMLSQYAAAMKTFKNQHYRRYNWLIEGEEE